MNFKDIDDIVMPIMGISLPFIVAGETHSEETYNEHCLEVTTPQQCSEIITRVRLK